jgi:hypothetical protein
MPCPALAKKSPAEGGGMKALSLDAAMVSLLFAALLPVVGGCGRIGATRFPEPSPTFVPYTEVSARFDNVWRAANEALEKNRVGIAASNKDEGRITTDYVQGQSQVVVTSVGSSRYKYLIRMSPVNADTTRVNVLATLESSASVVGRHGGGPVGGAWRDVSNDNKELVAKLENWLYEQIQVALQKK